MSKKQTGPTRVTVTSVRASVSAVVTAVPEGKLPFVVTYPVPGYISSRDLGPKISITFSLSLWTGDSPPEPGQIVDLSKIKKYVRGWRAFAANPVMLTSSNQQ